MKAVPFRLCCFFMLFLTWTRCVLFKRSLSACFCNFQTPAASVVIMTSPWRPPWPRREVGSSDRLCCRRCLLGYVSNTQMWSLTLGDGFLCTGGVRTPWNGNLQSRSRITKPPRAIIHLWIALLSAESDEWVARGRTPLIFGAFSRRLVIVGAREEIKASIRSRTQMLKNRRECQEAL